MAKKESRFKRINVDGVFSGNEIWVDMATGVQYLFHFDGSAAGLTLLVDAEGKPLLYHKTPDAPEF